MDMQAFNETLNRLKEIVGQEGSFIMFATSPNEGGTESLQLRTFGGISAIAEGWALYAERLAAESGWYGDDVEGLLGQLDAELLRARRLVVDTGLHSKRKSPPAGRRPPAAEGLRALASTLGCRRAPATLYGGASRERASPARFPARLLRQ